jgi:hypothetical protein
MSDIFRKYFEVENENSHDFFFSVCKDKIQDNTLKQTITLLPYHSVFINHNDICTSFDTVSIVDTMSYLMKQRITF